MFPILPLIVKVFGITEVQEDPPKQIGSTTYTMQQLFQDVKKKNEEIKKQFDSRNCDKNSVDLQKRLFYHKNLGSIGNDSPLEGTTRVIALYSTLEDLFSLENSCCRIIKKLPNSEKKQALIKEWIHIKKARTILSCSYQIALSLEQLYLNDCKENSPAFKQFCQKIKNTISKLKPGGLPLILPGGWHEHAILYEISATADSKGNRKLSFKIINRGEGVKQHLIPHLFSFRVLQMLATGRYQSYMIQNISPEAIEDSSFIEELLSPELKDHLPPNNSLTHHFTPRIASDTYNLCNKCLVKQGKGTLVRTKMKKLIHKNQETGNCAISCITGWLKEFLPEKTHARLKLLTTHRSMTILQNLPRRQNRKNWNSIINLWNCFYIDDKIDHLPLLMQIEMHQIEKLLAKHKQHTPSKLKQILKNLSLFLEETLKEPVIKSDGFLHSLLSTRLPGAIQQFHKSLEGLEQISPSSLARYHLPDEGDFFIKHTVSDKEKTSLPYLLSKGLKVRSKRTQKLAKLNAGF